jgi:O-methyltransferase
MKNISNKNNHSKLTSLISDAINLHKSGQLKLAAQKYKEIIAIDPKNPEALHLLGVILHQKENHIDALDLINKAIQIQPNSASFHSNKGLVLSALKMYADAVKSYDKAIYLNVNYADAYYNRGLALHKFRKYEEAIASYENAINLKPKQQEYKIGLLNAVIFASKNEETLKYVEKYSSQLWSHPDENFNKDYCHSLLATKTTIDPLKRRDRFRFLINKFKETIHLNGLVAECGCFKGLSSHLMCKTIKSNNFKYMGEEFQIFDSFEGLSVLQGEDQKSEVFTNSDRPPSQIMKEGNFAVDLEKVRANLSEFPRIQFFKGWIPDAFPSENPNQYRFVHVDVDLYQPTLDSFEYFWPKILPGGIMLCDDFNWSGAEKAVKEFSLKHGVAYEVSPFNQAYFIKK